MRFFFYGTLLDRDVTALVLARRLPPQAYTEARLPGHARRRVQGGTYPIVIADARGEVSGAIVGGLSARDVARLAAYEGPGYRVVPLRVKVRGRMTVVSVFEPIQSRLKPSRELWDLSLWQRRHKRLFVERLKRALSGRPAYSRP
ncbi:gamma-glutamylcyclotransferase [Reyranella aquatilis]|uniref:Putative gamma-glutamylcyclotransferase n=1 Tax=Reyranella aquatilis TaxID=2035356 RepID=A0ABS8KPI0_9HYPH|nr:gamma-glutamylcyclotransferase family protein [Reyranella aquatilis]MCC8427960.1 gamma-glutamylcyclotransferase [Reyranella aquatilis]